MVIYVLVCWKLILVYKCPACGLRALYRAPQIRINRAGEYYTINNTIQLRLNSVTRF